jgi:hypothetical protein
VRSVLFHTTGGIAPDYGVGWGYCSPHLNISETRISFYMGIDPLDAECYF